MGLLPRTLKPGAVLRLVRSCLLLDRKWREAHGGPTRLISIYPFILKGYFDGPAWSGCGGYGVQIERFPRINEITRLDEGWMADRFELVRDGDGSDYQAPDDIDLSPLPYTTAVTIHGCDRICTRCQTSCSDRLVTFVNR